jgi:ABC-type phosphate/phosphonate transport system ATPase subunit
VLADEPTAALDSVNGHGVMRLLADIARQQNRSILVVTHDPRTIAYADRVIHIEDGRIVSEEHRERVTTNQVPADVVQLHDVAADRNGKRRRNRNRGRAARRARSH